MGVKQLWTILTPYCERKPLFELQGKTLAIDLSCWIVDTQNATENVIQPKMYLRNLYFRTINLLLQDIRPVFVLEGKAPDLKQKTIERRNEIQQIKKTGTIAEKKVASKRGRTRFNHILKECQEMLECMGLKCVQGYGEAEAMCAYLDADGMVDGCVSQDNDCFLYGARVVYRNFNLSGPAASCGSIDVYRMEKTENALNLNRNKMVALALLCGCDYDDGLNGVGREAALKLFSHIGDQDVLDRLRSWRTDGKKFDKIESQMTNSKICTSCGHDGNVRVHGRNGCLDCCTTKSCNDHYKEKRKLIMNEITLRKKALIVESFPNEEIIDEYLVRKGPVPSSLDLKWEQPKLVKFIFFMEKKLGWEPNYSFEKLLPLITRWQLITLPEVTLRESISFMKYSVDLPITRLLFPEEIKKIRNIKSVASYEIIWNDSEGFLDGLVSLISPSGEKSNNEDENFDKIDSDEQKTKSEGSLVTIEPQSLVVKCYPELVEKFEESRAAKKRSKNPKTKAKTRKNDKERNVEGEEEGRKKPAAKRERKKLVDVINNKKIDNYLSKTDAESLEDSFNRLEITPKRLKCVKEIEEIRITEGISKMNNTLDKMFDNLTADDFYNEDGDGEFDMSVIIDEICRKKTRENFIPIDIDIPKEEKLSSGRKNSREKPKEEEKEVAITAGDNLLTSNYSNNELKKQDSSTNESERETENQEEDDSDEFADIDNYVPLSQRVNILPQIL